VVDYIEDNKQVLFAIPFMSEEILVVVSHVLKTVIIAIL
jgi:hypothetical protein